MNTPIIAPWLIYLIGTINAIHAFFIVLAALSGIVLMIIISVLCEGNSSDKVKTHLYVCCPIFLVFLGASVFIPTKTTMVQMLVSQHITPANVDKAIDTGKTIHDILKKDVLDILAEIKK